MNTRMLFASIIALSTASLGLALAGGGGTSGGATGANFDFLKDADRKAMQERFVKELWPLLMRGEKEGCIGCHALPKTAGAMKVTGNVEKDFRLLVKEGFFLPGDSGSMLSHILSKDRKKRMPPPGKGEPWTDAEVKVLATFVKDLDTKQQKKAK